MEYIPDEEMPQNAQKVLRTGRIAGGVSLILGGGNGLKSLYDALAGNSVSTGRLIVTGVGLVGAAAIGGMNRFVRRTETQIAQGLDSAELQAVEDVGEPWNTEEETYGAEE